MMRAEKLKPGEKRVAYEGKRVSVEETMSEKGYAVERVMVRNAAVVIPVIMVRGEEGTSLRVLIEENNRPVIGVKLIEIPAGKIEDREEPAEAAKRETTEETGFEVVSIRSIFNGDGVYSSPGFTTEKMYFFVAVLGKRGRQELDEHEEISVNTVAVEDARKMAEEGKIRDLKSIAGIEWLHIHQYELVPP